MSQHDEKYLQELMAKEVQGEPLSSVEIDALLDSAEGEPFPEDKVQRIWNGVKARAAREGRLHELEGTE